MSCPRNTAGFNLQDSASRLVFVDIEIDMTVLACRKLLGGADHADWRLRIKPRARRCDTAPRDTKRNARQAAWQACLENGPRHRWPIAARNHQTTTTDQQKTKQQKNGISADRPR